MAEIARSDSPSEIRLKVLASLLPPLEDERAIRRIVLPLRELVKRDLTQGFLLKVGRLGRSFASSLRTLPPEASLLSPLFLPILPWIDLIQGLGLRLLFDLTWNPFLIPPEDPRYLSWGEDRDIMSELIQREGLTLDPARTISAASARCLELKIILGRVDEVIVPTVALARDFRAIILGDHVWAFEFPSRTEIRKEGPPRIIWRGSEGDSIGLARIWSETLQVLSNHGQNHLQCFGPVPRAFLEQAASSEAKVSFLPDLDRENMLREIGEADLVLVSHASDPFYERLSTIDLQESIFAAGGKAALLGCGPIAHRFIGKFGGLEANGKEEWKEKLEWLLADEKAHKAHRPILPKSYSQAEDLSILLEGRSHE